MKRRARRALDRFFTGVPCKWGHIEARYVSTTQCVKCQAEYARRKSGCPPRPSKEEYLEKVRDVVEKRGGMLRSTEYVDAKSKLNILCALGLLNSTRAGVISSKEGGAQSANSNSIPNAW